MRLCKPFSVPEGLRRMADKAWVIGVLRVVEVHEKCLESEDATLSKLLWVTHEIGGSSCHLDASGSMRIEYRVGLKVELVCVSFHLIFHL